MWFEQASLSTQTGRESQLEINSWMCRGRDHLWLTSKMMISICWHVTVNTSGEGAQRITPTSAPNRRMIDVTAWAPERQWEDQGCSIYAKWVKLYSLKQSQTRPKLISQCTRLFAEWHHEQQPLNCILRDSCRISLQVMVIKCHYDTQLKLLPRDHNRAYRPQLLSNGCNLESTMEIIRIPTYRSHQQESLPNCLLQWVQNNHTADLSAYLADTEAVQILLLIDPM